MGRDHPGCHGTPNGTGTAHVSCRGHRGGPVLDAIPSEHYSNARIPGEIWGKEKKNTTKNPLVVSQCFEVGPGQVALT